MLVASGCFSFLDLRSGALVCSAITFSDFFMGTLDGVNPLEEKSRTLLLRIVESFVLILATMHRMGQLSVKDLFF